MHIELELPLGPQLASFLASAPRGVLGPEAERMRNAAWRSWHVSAGIDHVLTATLPAAGKPTPSTSVHATHAMQRHLQQPLVSWSPTDAPSLSPSATPSPAPSPAPSHAASYAASPWPVPASAPSPDAAPPSDPATPRPPPEFKSPYPVCTRDPPRRLKQAPAFSSPFSPPSHRSSPRSYKMPQQAQPQLLPPQLAPSSSGEWSPRTRAQVQAQEQPQHSQPQLQTRTQFSQNPRDGHASPCSSGPLSGSEPPLSRRHSVKPSALRSGGMVSQTFIPTHGYRKSMPYLPTREEDAAAPSCRTNESRTSDRRTSMRRPSSVSSGRGLQQTPRSSIEVAGHNLAEDWAEDQAAVAPAPDAPPLSESGDEDCEEDESVISVEAYQRAKSPSWTTLSVSEGSEPEDCPGPCHKSEYWRKPALPPSSSSSSSPAGRGHAASAADCRLRPRRASDRATAPAPQSLLPSSAHYRRPSIPIPALGLSPLTPLRRRTAPSSPSGRKRPLSSSA